MKDMLSILYTELLKNSVISTNVTATRIAYYDYGEERDQTKPFIILIPLDPPNTGVSGSNQELNIMHTYQIDVQGSNRLEVKEIAKAVKSVMFSLGYGQLPEGLDEWFYETKRFVDARRYRGLTKLYDKNY